MYILVLTLPGSFSAISSAIGRKQLVIHEGTQVWFWLTGCHGLIIKTARKEKSLLAGLIDQSKNIILKYGALKI